MERYVLFSPVGMTDPISDYHDGSMLHIARVYRPEKIYLYLSKETMDFRDRDNRYRAALDLLGKKIGVNFEVEEIPRPELTEVQLFDFFYDDFEKELSKIREENPSAVVLLNVSSGSPAMKSSLQVIAALDEKAGYVPIQVASPNRAHNEHDDKPKDFNLEIFWEANEDNSENYKNRTSVSNNFSFLNED